MAGILKEPDYSLLFVKFFVLLLMFSATTGDEVYDNTDITEHDYADSINDRDIPQLKKKTDVGGDEEMRTNAGKLKDSNYMDIPLNKEDVTNEDTTSAEARRGSEELRKLIWLKFERDRLVRENERFKKRLNEFRKRYKHKGHKKLKNSQKEEGEEDGNGNDELTNEDKRKQLEKIEKVLEDRLEDMNTSVQKSTVEHLKVARGDEELPLQREKKEKNRAAKKSTRKLSSTTALPRHTSRKRRRMKKKKTKVLRSTVTQEQDSILKATKSTMERIAGGLHSTASKSKIPSGIFMEEDGTRVVKARTSSMTSTTINAEDL